MAEHADQASPGEIGPERTEPSPESPAAESPVAVTRPAAAVPPARPLPRQDPASEPAAKGPAAKGPAAKGPAAKGPAAKGPDSGPAAAAGAPGPAAAGEKTAPGAEQGGPAAPARTGESKRWELIIAVSIALVTVTGAALTYLSIQQESAAVEADRQSVVETLQVQDQVVAANTEARAYGVLAARYRQLMAEASVLAVTDPDQAAMLRADAAGFTLNGVTEYTTGTGAATQYNFAAALQGALTVDQSVGVPADQPARTAALAEQHRQVAGWLALCVVGLLCVVVLLTLARVVTAEWLKRALAAAAAAGYLAAVTAALVQLA
jgi:hypothetical protein